MTKKLNIDYTPKAFEDFLKQHPCTARYSLTQERLLIGIVDTVNDLYELNRTDTDQFDDYINVAYQHADEYTATIKAVRARGTKYMPDYAQFV